MEPNKNATPAASIFCRADEPTELRRSESGSSISRLVHRLRSLGRRHNNIKVERWHRAELTSWVKHGYFVVHL